MRANVRARFAKPAIFGILFRADTSLGSENRTLPIESPRIDRTRCPAISVNNGEPKSTIIHLHHHITKKCRRCAQGELTPALSYTNTNTKTKKCVAFNSPDGNTAKPERDNLPSVRVQLTIFTSIDRTAGWPVLAARSTLAVI
jgi:hypothetical protein